MKIPSIVLLVPAVAAAAVAAAAVHPSALAQGEPTRRLVPVPEQGAAGPEFDAEEAAQALSAADLDARLASFGELVATAERDPAAREWLEERARGTGELAWTAKLALRELERSRPRTPFDVWSGAHDLDDFERMLDDFTGRMAPGWNYRVDPLVVPFPGLQGRTPMVPGQGSSQGRRVDIQNGADGWTLRITETVDGKETVREFQGATLEEILEQNPELKQEVGVSGSLVGPGFTFRIFSPQDQTFDFDSLFGNLGVRPGLTPEVGGEEEGQVRTDRLGVVVRPATDEEGGRGLYVLSTVPGSIANLLGISGGSILLQVNGRELASVEDVTAALAERGPDGRVEALWRDTAGRRRTGSWRP